MTRDPERDEAGSEHAIHRRRKRAAASRPRRGQGTAPRFGSTVERGESTRASDRGAEDDVLAEIERPIAENEGAEWQRLRPPPAFSASRRRWARVRHTVVGHGPSGGGLRSSSLIRPIYLDIEDETPRTGFTVQSPKVPRRSARLW